MTVSKLTYIKMYLTLLHVQTYEHTYTHIHESPWKGCCISMYGFPPGEYVSVKRFLYLFEKQLQRHKTQSERDPHLLFHSPNGHNAQVEMKSQDLVQVSHVDVSAQLFGPSVAAFQGSCIRSGTARMWTVVPMGCSCCRWSFYVLWPNPGLRWINLEVLCHN